MAYDGVHDHVEERGEYGVSLCHSAVTFEQEAKVSASPGHHGQLVLVCPKESEHPGADPVRRKDLEASIPIQVSMRLLEVQYYLEEDGLIHFCKML